MKERGGVGYEGEGRGGVQKLTGVWYKELGKGICIARTPFLLKEAYSDLAVSTDLLLQQRLAAHQHSHEVRTCGFHLKVLGRRRSHVSHWMPLKCIGILLQSRLHNKTRVACLSVSIIRN